MNIQSSKRKIINNKVHHIYIGTLDGVPTKWITKTRWKDKKINMRFDKKKGIVYYDSKGNEILCYEEDQEEYKKY